MNPAARSAAACASSTTFMRGLLLLRIGCVLAANLVLPKAYTEQELDQLLRNETAYVEWQGSKTRENPSWIKSVDKRIEQFVRQQWAREDVRGRTVLCIGARAGGEVRAFRALGAFAVGIDLEPAASAHDVVLRANALRLPFAPECVDRVFTNVLDHIPDLPRFCAEVARVLKPGGHLIADVLPQLRTQDEWAVRDTGTTEFYRELTKAMETTRVMELVELVQRLPNRTHLSRSMMSQDRMRWAKHTTGVGGSSGTQAGSSSRSAVHFATEAAASVDERQRSRAHEQEGPSERRNTQEEPLPTRVAEEELSETSIAQDGPSETNFTQEEPSQEAGTSLERRLDPRAFVFPKAIASQRVNHQHVHELSEASMLRIGAVGINLLSKPCQQQLSNASVRALITASAADDIGPAIYEYDHLLRADSCATAPWADQRMHRDLRERGWTAVKDWRLDLEALKRQSYAILDPLRNGAHAKSGHIFVKNPDLPALQPILKDSNLSSLLEAYLGGLVRYDGHVLLHVTAHANTQNYASALWHHDRCGSRLKLFIFLHDVAEDGSEL